MARFGFTVDTRATPDQVVRAFTDFSDRRREIWRESLDPGQYAVREIGDRWALVLEGTRWPRIWVVDRYDWSAAGRITLTAQESNFCRPGSRMEVGISPRADGGSRLTVRWDRRPQGARGALVVPLIRVVGPVVMRRSWTRSLDRFADESAR